MKTFELVETQNGTIINMIDENGQSWFVPSDESNRLYQEYLASLENEGI
jgi:hypothetical protein